MTYAAAKAQCESDGSFLAIPRSEAENDFIAGLIPNESIWIGINDIAKEGSFVAVDGSRLSWTKWDLNEPNDVDNHYNDNDEWLYGEDAVEIRQYGHEDIPKSWNDQQVDRSRKFVCLLHI